MTCGDARRGPGRILISGRVVGEERQIAVDLNERDYDQATLAHLRGQRVLVVGQLNREEGRWLISQPRTFSVLPDLTNPE